MTTFETMQEKEDKILTPLFLITDPWLWALMLYKPPDSSWWREHSFWDMSLLGYLSTGWELKATFLFPPNSCLRIFYSASVDRESQDLGKQKLEKWHAL